MRSTKHRVGILVLAFLLCFGCLAGCGRDSGKKEENKTVTATPTATATPTPTPTPEPWKSYEKAGTDNVYRVPVAELADGATVTEGSVGGEYVLLQTYKPGEDIPGPEWGELLLLRPAFSGETASFNPGYPVHKIRVIPDGTVFLVESVKAQAAKRVYHIRGDARLPAKNVRLRNIHVKSSAKPSTAEHAELTVEDCDQ